METADPGGPLVLCLVCSQMCPEVDTPGPCGDLSCVTALPDLVSQPCRSPRGTPGPVEGGRKQAPAIRTLPLQIS